MRRRTFTHATALALAGLPGLASAEAGSFWAMLREGGCVLLMRHAQTEPGTGDPPEFTLGDCRTQRNLSEAGRAQARRVGDAFQRERIRIDDVRSSAWCRCVDTARLAFRAPTVWAPLNSSFGNDDRDMNTQDVLDALQNWPPRRNMALVTHQANITALTGLHPAMGEMVLTRPTLESGEVRLRTQARQIF